MTEARRKRNFFQLRWKASSAYLLPAAVLLAGVFLGAIAAGVLFIFKDITLNQLVDSYIQMIHSSTGTVFVSSFVSLFAYWAAGLILSFFAFGRYLLYLLPFGRGMGYGLIAGALCCYYNTSGFIYSMVALAPGMLISSGALIVFVLEGSKFSNGSWTGHKGIRSQSKRFLLHALIVFIVFALSALVDMLLALLSESLMIQ